VIRLIQFLFRWNTYLDVRLTRMENAMSEVQSDQQHLDADVAAEGASIDAIEAEIANLKNQPAGTPLDFTALDATVARLKGDEPAPAPAPAAPAADVPAATPDQPAQ
jgi:hypothetical protein